MNEISALQGTPNLPTGFQGRQLSIHELGMLLNIERSQIMDAQLREQFDEMQEKNNILANLTKCANQLRTRRPSQDDGSAAYYGEFIDHNGTTQSVHAYLLANGIDIERAEGDEMGTQQQFDAAISNLKSTMDANNSQSQYDMIRIEGTMNKGNLAMTFASNWLEATFAPAKTVVGNIRG